LLYGDILLRSEIEHCKYYFEVADVEGLKQTYDVYERESKRSLEAGLIAPSYDYVLKCSHLFNVLDTRGAIGVTERAGYFRRMRDMTRRVAKAFAEQRQTIEYPLDKLNVAWSAKHETLIVEEVQAVNAPADFLLEIGVEELPADDTADALAQLQSLAPALLNDLRLGCKSLDVYATPRRLVVLAKGLAPRQTDVERVERGPSEQIAFKDGAPTKAAEGFARGKGVAVSDLRVEDMDGGRYIVATVRETGRPAAQVLSEKLTGFIASLKFGKAMRWNSSGIAFSRPIRWIVALLGEYVIPFSYAEVESSRITRGLRPYGSPEYRVRDAAEYLDILRGQRIMLHAGERRAAISAQVEALAKAVGGRALQDEALLDEVTNLVEAPTALRGNFEVRYLDLPRAVLVTVMRDKQRYFALEDANSTLLPHFITVRNGDDQHLDLVQDGNEQVLRARFSDAHYFFSQDTQKVLDDFLPRLGTLTFQEKLGSMLDKNNRVAGLVASFGAKLGVSPDDIANAEAAARVLKADLATQVVVEMTSLQGTMGREYARRSGRSAAVAQAIYEHWLPRGAGDSLPQSKPGVILALLDRLDSLVGLFAAGLAPQATTDPYGLRRAALGIIQILVAQKLDLDLREAVALVAHAQPIAVSEAVQTQGIEFIGGRLRSWLDEGSWRADVIAAVLAQQAHNPYRALEGIRQLSAWVAREDWQPTLEGFARCVRITRGEAQRYAVDPALFNESVEKRLYDAYQSAQTRMNGEGNVDSFLSAFSPMLPAVTAFFDGVLVNAEDAAVRQNRLGLLQAISAMQQGHADLSQLAGF
jgi:glycyl-tRNA synthetase